MRDLTVLVWTDHFYEPDFERERRGETVEGEPWRMAMTRDRSRVDSCDAVWFHGPSVLDLPPKSSGQPWAMMSMESDEIYPFQASAAAQVMFDIHMTCRLDSDVPTPYGNWDWGPFDTPVPDREGPDDAAPILYLASHEVPERDEYVRRLMTHVPVDALGRCLNNRDIVSIAGPGGVNSPAQSAAATRAYKFFLAFENSRSFDYVTEKLYRPLALGTVPIYRGAPNVTEFLPARDAAIIADDFASPAELAEYILHLDTDAAAYGRLHEWRHQRWSDCFHAVLDVGSVPAMDRLGSKLAHGCDRDCACGGRLRPPPSAP